MMIRSLQAGFRIIQVPVNYLPRVGQSSVTGDPVKAFFLGMRMIRLIVSYRLQPGIPREAPAVGVRRQLR
jgi:hypothetical protein